MLKQGDVVNVAATVVGVYPNDAPPSATVEITQLDWPEAATRLWVPLSAVSPVAAQAPADDARRLPPTDEERELAWHVAVAYHDPKCKEEAVIRRALDFFGTADGAGAPAVPEAPADEAVQLASRIRNAWGRGETDTAWAYALEAANALDMRAFHANEAADAGTKR